MFLARAILAATGAALALGCVHPPPVPPVQEPASASAALIAIKVVFNDGALNSGLPTYLVYFVRIEQGGDPLSQQVLIPSNYFEDGYVYLLNARPGRYAAVAAAWLDEGGVTKTQTVPVGGGGGFTGSVGFSYTTGPIADVNLLPVDTIHGTLVDVEPGSVAFMGEWRLKKPYVKKLGDDDDADAAQRHYSRLLEANGIGTSHHRGSEPESDRSDEAILKFMRHARKRLADTGWWAILEDAAK